MKQIKLILFVAVPILYVTFVHIVFYKYTIEAQQKIVQQAVEEYYDSTTMYSNYLEQQAIREYYDSIAMYNFYSEQKYLDN